ncbi:MAG: DUF1698 domain-containing protein, partial [Pseudomonadota bacterium]
MFDYSELQQRVEGTALTPLSALIPADFVASITHGDFVKWQAALKALPATNPATTDLLSQVCVGTAEQLTDTERTTLRDTLMQLHPWRKGPFDLFGLHVDTEWRSDWKWNR